MCVWMERGIEITIHSIQQELQFSWEINTERGFMQILFLGSCTTNLILARLCMCWAMKSCNVLKVLLEEDPLNLFIQIFLTW